MTNKRVLSERADPRPAMRASLTDISVPLRRTRGLAAVRKEPPTARQARQNGNQKNHKKEHDTSRPQLPNTQMSITDISVPLRQMRGRETDRTGRSQNQAPQPQNGVRVGPMKAKDKDTSRQPVTQVYLPDKQATPKRMNGMKKNG